MKNKSFVKHIIYALIALVCFVLALIPLMIPSTVSESAYNVILGLKITAFVLLGLCAVIIVISILMQTTADEGGTNAITGVSETYYAQNKGSTRDGILKKVTVICAAIIFYVAIFLITLLKIKT